VGLLIQLVLVFAVFALLNVVNYSTVRAETNEEKEL